MLAVLQRIALVYQRQLILIIFRPNDLALNAEHCDSQLLSTCTCFHCTVGLHTAGMFLLISSSVVRWTIENSEVPNRITVFLSKSEPIPQRFEGNQTEPKEKSISYTPTWNPGYRDVNTRNPIQNMSHSVYWFSCDHAMCCQWELWLTPS